MQPIHSIRSHTVKRVFERAPRCSLLKATGAIRSDGDFDLIGISNRYLDLIPGHVHRHAFGQVAREAEREAGGVPFEWNTLVDDGHRQALPHERLRRRRAESGGKERTLPPAFCFPMPACVEGARLPQSPSSG